MNLQAWVVIIAGIVCIAMSVGWIALTEHRVKKLALPTHKEASILNELRTTMIATTMVTVVVGAVTFVIVVWSASTSPAFASVSVLADVVVFLFVKLKVMLVKEDVRVFNRQDV